MMKSQRWLCTTLLLTGACLGWVAPVTAGTLSQPIAAKALKAKKLADNKHYDKAIGVLTPLPKNGYDKAYVARMLGIFYWQNEQVKPAIKALTIALSDEQLDPALAWSTRRMLADVLLMDQQYKSALSQYYQLVDKVDLNKSISKHQHAELWLRISQIHYQLQDWQKTLTSITRYQQLGMPDAVQPLSLKVGAQLQLSQWHAAIPTLKKLLVLEPQQKRWWMQLVNLEMRVDRQSDALDSMALARLQGIEFNSQEVRLLAQLYAQNGIPERAAQLIATLDNASDDKELLVLQAQYWQRAKEWDKAIDTWQLAARHTAKYRWNVAQLMLQQGQYRSALQVLDSIDDPQRKVDVALARTRALYQLDQLDHALKQAHYANRLQPSTEAKSWIRYLQQLKKLNAKRTS